MKTMSYQIPLSRSSKWAKALAMGSVVVGALALSAGHAHARDNSVYWSVGVNGPGVSVGVSNAPAVVVSPPVVIAPRPYVVQPRPVIVQPAYAYPYPYPYRYVRPVVVVEEPYYAPYPGRRYWDGRHDRRDWGHGRGNGHRKHGDRWDDDDGRR